MICQNKQKKNKWAVIVVYDFKKAECPEVDPQKYLGVDLGVRNAFYCAMADSERRLSVCGAEISEYKKRIRHRRLNCKEVKKFPPGQAGDVKRFLGQLKN